MVDLFPNLISQLAVADEQLLLMLNGAHNPFFDGVMWMVSDKWVWTPCYALMAYFIFRRGLWRRGTVCVLMIVLTIAVTDQTCASYLRPALERLRPSNPDNPVSAFIHIVNGYRGGKYGLPSCHAANSFALAIFVSLYFRKRRITLLMMTWTVVVSYSRIYLGVHYPGDILFGMFVGGLYAMLFFHIYSIFVSLQSRVHFRSLYKFKIPAKSPSIFASGNKKKQ